MKTSAIEHSTPATPPAQSGVNLEAGVSILDVRHSRRGFSLVEIIGVLAVIAILSALLVPSVIRRADMAALTKEVSDLSTISNALVLASLQNQKLPDETTWTNVAANWLSMPARQVATTSRGYRRVFLVDSNGWLGIFTPGSPYTQTTYGNGAAPTVARAMIVSTIAKDLPIASGRPALAQFDAIWNTAPNAKPTTWTNWSGKGDDLVIQRLNFQPLFHHLVLVNHDSEDAAKVSIGANTPVKVTQTGGYFVWDRWYLDGTLVGLCDATGTPVRRFQLTNDVSFVFEGSVWQGQIGGGESSEVMAQGFADLSAKFLSAQWYPGANHPGRGDQQGALTGMFNFMLVFGLWADQYPHYPRHGANANQVPEYQLLDALVNNNSPGAPGGSGYLDLFTGAGGLLAP